MRPFSIILISLLASVPAYSFAQEDEEIPPPPAAEEQPEEKAEEKAEGTAEKTEPDVGATEEAKQGTPFTIRRGFFAEGDLGIFVTIGGVNTNSPMLNSRSTSNIQPYISTSFGYDIVDAGAFAMGIGARLAMGLNGGAGRADQTEPINDANTKSNDYSIQELGAVLNFMFMVGDRVGLTLKLHGGAGFVSPDPTLPADAEDAGKFVFAPVFGGQFGVELYTLLNDFSVGLQVGFLGAIAGGEFIPGLSGTIPIKYTF